MKNVGYEGPSRGSRQRQRPRAPSADGPRGLCFLLLFCSQPGPAENDGTRFGCVRATRGAAIVRQSRKEYLTIQCRVKITRLKKTHLLLGASPSIFEGRAGKDGWMAEL
ncbi:hypothetical protein GWI33_018337 [Rhynchophorus ferrugineus]|uniref:Uncharacterized protein n=1 Tax=Rhynchophorus ferrugineus TaxID=354439 RepID=A0A834M897_RHYFE|nr:hypothetical protein GWI33_018337 [Rhynchophorus ferrugineus]